MHIGVFDSGLGGLSIAKELHKKLPYSFVYLGDTKRVPYGDRSSETIYEFLCQGLDFLFAQNCALVIVACNTASAEALRQVQQTWLPINYPDRKVLGVLVPTAEVVATYTRIGIIGTTRTITSQSFTREITKHTTKAKIWSVATPLLVPMIEAHEYKELTNVLNTYLKPFKKHNIQALILGCTHYPLIRSYIQKIVPGVKLISQNAIIPNKTKVYLANHPEVTVKLAKKHTIRICVTDITPEIAKRTKIWFPKTRIEKIYLEEQQ